MKRKLLTFCLAVTLLFTSACSSKKPTQKTAGERITLDATYIAESASKIGVEKWVFEKSGNIQMINSYTYTKEQIEDRMKLHFENSELDGSYPPFECTVKNEDGKYIFTQIQNGNEIGPSASQFELEEGDDGLADTESFKGTYANKGIGVTYRFDTDGKAEIDTAAAYTIADGNLTISTASGSAAYPVKINQDESEITITVEEQEVVLKKE